MHVWSGRIRTASHRLGADWLFAAYCTYTSIQLISPPTFSDCNIRHIQCSVHSAPPHPSQAVFSGTPYHFLLSRLPSFPKSLTNPSFYRKIPFRLSAPQKARQRKRLRAVDTVIATIDTALRKQGSSLKEVERWKAEMPREEEMRPKDKYTVFDRKEKRYRKGIHSE